LARAIVVGGSLGGLIVANLLLREGWDVQVHERAAEPLVGRGAGIATHQALCDSLAKCGIEIDDRLGVEVRGRIVIDRSGRIIGRSPLRQVLTSWGGLYDRLLDAFPSARYHLDSNLVALDQRADGVTARFANGTSVEGELLVGADGIRSAVRGIVAPQVQPEYAGYVAWRGLVHEQDLSPKTREAIFEWLAFSLAPSEHMLGYPVPGPDNSRAAGQRSYNFVWYRPTDAGVELRRLCTDATGRVHEGSIPPPLIRDDVIESTRTAAWTCLAPQLAEVVTRTARPFFQPIYDVESTQVAFGRVALLGDAAFVARPHCGAGVTKAAIDAMTLIDHIGRTGGHVPAALEHYSRNRVTINAAIVEHARELGNYLQSLTQPGKRRPTASAHHTPEAVLREIAVPYESLNLA
jgi:2-polyprenyl-6-methoxyphenol hydroxylase-like FAD-dependent oxidoreductase